MNELMASKPAAGAKPKMKRKAFEKELRKTKSPPTGGSHLPHAHPGSFEMRRTVPAPTRGVPATGTNLISPEIAEPVG